MYVYWCPVCKIQTERSWHIFKKGPPLIPQLDEDHDCVRIEVVPAAERDDLRDLLASIQWSGYSVIGEEPCPVCSQEKRNGHDQSCLIGEVLRREA